MTIDTKAIREALAAGTPGPYVTLRWRVYSDADTDEEELLTCWGDRRNYDAHSIALLHNAAPALCAAADELERVREQCESWQRAFDQVVEAKAGIVKQRDEARRVSVVLHETLCNLPGGDDIAADVSDCGTIDRWRKDLANG